MAPPRILIVDHRAFDEAGARTFEYLPDLSAFEDYVEVASHLDVEAWREREQAFRDAYAFVLIHANQPTDELDFLDNDDGRFYVRFHGEPSTDILDEYLELDRRTLKQYLVPFIDHFRSTGEVRWQVFVGEPLTTEAEPPPSTSTPDEHAVPAASIRFTADATQAGEGVLSIRLTPDSRLDVTRTIAPLAEAEEARWVLLEQDYPGRPAAGLNLLLHLRLGAFLGPASRFPIAIRLASSPEELVRHNATYAAIFAPGVTRLDRADPWPTTPPELISEGDHEAFLGRAAVPEPDFYGPHDVANDWGSVSMCASVSSLRSGAALHIGPWALRAERLLREPYYWRLLGRLAGASAQPSKTHLTRWKEWTKFLRRVRDEHGSPLRVLCLDDEWASGWGDALRELFGVEEGLSVVEGYPDAGPFVLDDALAITRRERWDVVLLDLRLEPEQEPAASQPDPRALAKLSGVRFLTALRQEQPTLPVVVTTGSSKAWTYRHLLSEGADGYWVKEHPHMLARPADALDHVLTLPKEVQVVVKARGRIEYLWHLAREVDRRMNGGALILRGFLWPDGTPAQAPSPNAIRRHLDGVISRIEEAYGHLALRPAPAFASAFHLNKPANLAFLALWSCMSELSEALLRPAGSAYYWRDRSGAVRRFWDGARADDTGIRSSEGIQLQLSPSYDGAPSDALIVLLLDGVLDPAERRSVVEQFRRVRALRNDLRYTHGTSRSVKSTQDATPWDVEELAGLIEKLLRLDLT